MILLFDLDDTLLGNVANDFVPTYLKAISTNFDAIINPKQFLYGLRNGTLKMLANLDPAKTLEEVFDENFYPSLGIPKEKIIDQINNFYVQVYPELKNNTIVIPEAFRLLHSLIEDGHKIIIATNPLFPQIATKQRLEWAGLNSNQLDFQLITTFENFHFAKPNLEYYAEILAQNGWMNETAAMIGNDLNDDIQPATELGLPTFHVNLESNFESNEEITHSHGTLDQVKAWVDQIAKINYTFECATPASVLAILRSTPATLSTFSKSAIDAAWQFRPNEHEWNNTEIICHLRDLDRDINFNRINSVLYSNNPFISAINTDAWAEQRNYHQEDRYQSLDQFISVRKKLITLLSGLDASDWFKPARHSIFGPTNLFELMKFIAQHDRAHIQQIVDNQAKWKVKQSIL